MDISIALGTSCADSINVHGGDAKVINLPEIGIKGNTHFPFSDFNNVEIADLQSEFMHEKGLDKWQLLIKGFYRQCSIHTRPNPSRRKGKIIPKDGIVGHSA